MALLARALVLLKVLDDMWWIHGKGIFEVVHRDVQGTYQLMPVHYKCTMDWPLQMLGDEDVFYARQSKNSEVF
jgi:hypothetical protein